MFSKYCPISPLSFFWFFFQPSVPMSLSTPSPIDPDGQHSDPEANPEGPDSSKLHRRGALVPPKMEPEMDDPIPTGSGRASVDQSSSSSSKSNHVEKMSSSEMSGKQQNGLRWVLKSTSLKSNLKYSLLLNVQFQLRAIKFAVFKLKAIFCRNCMLNSP